VGGRPGDGTAAVYAPLKYQGVAVGGGEAVRLGLLLGYSGATGDVTEPQLHFAVIRVEKNSSGWPEVVSVPVTFYVGAPPVAFPPRAALRVTANYSGSALPPRAPSEGSALGPQGLALGPGEEAGAWLRLAIWLACGVAALTWFWKFSKG